MLAVAGGTSNLRFIVALEQFCSIFANMLQANTHLVPIQKF